MKSHAKYPVSELRAIINENWVHGSTVTYSFSLPDDQAKRTFFLLSQPSYVSQVLEMIGKDREYVQEGFAIWRQFVDINFVEVNTDPNIYIFKFESLEDNVGGYNNIISMGFNAELFNIYSKADKYRTILHEQAHSIGFEHLFNLLPQVGLLTEEKNLTSYSITNYKREKFQCGVISCDVVSITPMVFDIEAAQLAYGAPKIRAGNDTYDLHDLLYQRSLGERCNFATISTFPWDSGGVDTLNASRMWWDDEIAINLRPYERSVITYRSDSYAVSNSIQYIEMPNIEIENVICGKGSYSLTLNQLNNTVDIERSGQYYFPRKVQFNIDPFACGHDVILGFDSKQDTINLEKMPFNNEFHLVHSEIKTNYSMPGHRVVESSQQLTIEFDEKNSITLVNVAKKDLQPENFLFADRRENAVTERKGQYSHHTEIRDQDEKKSNTASPTNMRNTKENIAAELFEDMVSSFFFGMASTQMIIEVKSKLEEQGFSERQIKIIITASLAFVTGSFVSSGVSLLTNAMFKYFGFSEKNCELMSNATVIGVNVAKNCSLWGAAKFAAATVGGYAGSWCAMWVNRKYSSPVLPVYAREAEHRPRI